MAEVLVLAEHADGALKKVTAELITAARALGEPSAVVVGAPGTAAPLLDGLTQAGAAKIYVAESDGPSPGWRRFPRSRGGAPASGGRMPRRPGSTTVHLARRPQVRARRAPPRWRPGRGSGAAASSQGRIKAGPPPPCERKPRPRFIRGAGFCSAAVGRFFFRAPRPWWRAASFA